MLNKAVNYLRENKFFDLSFFWIIFSPIIISFSFSYNFAKMGVALYFAKLAILAVNTFILRAVFIAIKDIFIDIKSFKKENNKLELIVGSTLFLIILSIFINNLYLIYNLILIATFVLYAYLGKKELILLIANLGTLLAWTINQDTPNILSLFVYFACLFNSLNFVLIEQKYDEVKLSFKKINIKTNIKKFLLLSYSLTSFIIALTGVIMGTTNTLFIAVIITHILFLLQVRLIANNKYAKYLFIANQYFGLVIFAGILFDKL